MIFIYKFIPYILDISIIFIGLLNVYNCYKNGFIVSILRFIRYIISSIIAFFLSKIIINYIYVFFIKPIVFNLLNSDFKNMSTQANLEIYLEDLYHRLPNYIVDILNNLSKNSFLNFDAIDKSSLTSIESLSNTFSDNIVQPIINLVFYPFIIIMIIFVAGFFMKFVLSFFSNFFRIPFLGKINSLLGGIIGIFYSAVFIFFICAIIYLTINLTSNNLEYLNDQIISETFLFKIFYKFNPFLL